MKPKEIKFKAGDGQYKNLKKQNSVRSRGVEKPVAHSVYVVIVTVDRTFSLES